MAGSLPSPETAAKGGTPATAPVASGSQGGQAGHASASASAASTVAKFGGHKGGKKRADGLPSGSAEAAAADRDKDAQRKRNERAAKAAARKQLPPPLPSAGGTAVNPNPPQGSAVPASGERPHAEIFVAWKPDDLGPLIEELVNACEEHRVHKFTGKARQGKLKPETVKEIERDSHYPPAAKKGLCIGLPECGAKWLNKAGISAENKSEVVISLSGLAILTQGARLMARLDKIIAQQNAKNESSAESKAPNKAVGVSAD